jgi:Polyketide cyclase / dehydrase and lipid transport
MTTGARAATSVSRRARGTLHHMTDRTAASITVAADRATVMGVIADFGAYPRWATGVRSAEVVESDSDGRPLRVRFGLDVGVIKDSYVLAYEWDGDAGVSWQLAEPGSMVTEMSGAYQLAGGGSRTEVSYELLVGTKMPLPGLLRRRAERSIIDTALKGLKARAESRPVTGR